MKNNMAKMYHIEVLKPKGDINELVAFFRDVALPYWRSRGFEVKVYVREHGLGYGPVWFFTGIDAFGDIDGWAEKALGEEEGRRIMDKLHTLSEVDQGNIITDIEA
jgi:hypothetical protein